LIKTLVLTYLSQLRNGDYAATHPRRDPRRGDRTMLFVLPALILVLAIAGAYRVGRSATHSLAMKASAQRMPEGASHEFA
jgi:hypothetical protein